MELPTELGPRSASLVTRAPMPIPPNRSPTELPILVRTTIVVLSALALTGSLAATSSASPRGDRSTLQCGDTVTTDFALHADLTHCPDNGIVIGADEITVDLHGHTVEGDGTLVDCADGQSCDVGIDNTAGHDGVVIMNGSVREFALGAFVLGASGNRVRDLSTTENAFVGLLIGESTGTRIAHVSSTDNGEGSAGILIFDSHDNRIEHSTVARNGDGGIVAANSDGNQIVDNFVSGDPFGGTVLQRSSRNVVARNHAAGNGDDLIVSGDENTVAHNLISDALGCEENGCGAGIAVEDGHDNVLTANRIARTHREGIRVNNFDPEHPSSSTVIRGNLVRGAGNDGIAVATEPDTPSTVADTFLSGNISTGAADDGIDVDSPTTTLGRNIAARNGDLGIEAVAGVTDAGGNRAWSNGDLRQCTIVLCAH
jgi:parallel beta-helix repeat protein